MNKIPVALQLYSVREETKQDFAATVAQVAKIGYTGVELAGYGNLNAEGAHQALRDAGLAVASTHVSREALRDDLDGVAREARLLGANHIVLPYWSPEEFTSVESVEAIAGELDRYGQNLRERGLLFSFHNHKAEFRILEGRPILSWIMGASSPRNLSLELDVYWAHIGGYAPHRFLYEQGSRVRLLHLKDEKVIGDGPVDFTSVFTAAEAIGTMEWYIVEQENYDDPPLTSVAECFAQLKRWGKV